MLAALGGVLPFPGCVAFAGGFAGAGAVESPGSLLPSDGAAGAALAGGLTSLSCGCGFGVAAGGTGAGA